MWDLWELRSQAMSEDRGNLVGTYRRILRSKNHGKTTIITQHGGTPRPTMENNPDALDLIPKPANLVPFS